MKSWGKRGQGFENMVMLVIVVTVFAFVLLFAIAIFGTINDNLHVSQLLPASSLDVMQRTFNVYHSTVDGMSMFILIGMSIGLIIGAALMLVHPIFVVFYIIGLLFLTFTSAILSNLFQEMTATAELSGAAALMPVTSVIMGWLPVFVFIFGVVVGAVGFKIRSTITI
jgi:hypothetical protein